MSELLELAAKCEQATGPDRELDCAILAALDWRETDWESGERTIREMVERRGLAEFAKRADEGLSIWRHMPRLTASLDAAMTLVPEGWNFKVETVRHLSRGRIGLAIVWDGMHGPSDLGDAATPALALCAASIRARASLDIDVGEGKG